MTTTNEKRIYGIDALRAVAMMLGIVLHSSIAYKARPHRNWIHDGGFNYWAFDYLYFFIHSFRMPLFFLIAGFFCRLVYYRSGEKKFIIHRWKRVALPFIIAMIIIVPVSLVPYNIYSYYYDQGLSLHQAYTNSFHRLFKFSGLAHLWFLYDLVIFYILVLVIMRVKKLPGIRDGFAWFDKWVRGASFTSAWWILLLTIPMWIMLIQEKEIFVITDTYLIPRRINNLFFYGYLFVIGWQLQKRTDLFSMLTKRYRPFVWSGVILSVIVFALEWNVDLQSNFRDHVLGAMLGAFQVFFLTFGSIGLFLHFFKRESAFWKYISDASYWVYLIHLIIVTGLQLLFLNGPVPGILRFPLVMIITLAVTFVTYQYFVRYTAIGDLLHGHREKPDRPARKFYLRER